MTQKRSSRAAQGSGTIRQRPDGRWEARYTVGRDPGTGKQMQKSLYGDTQKEVRQKLQQIAVSLDDGSFIEPEKMSLAKWLDIWIKDFTGNVKEHTHVTYETQVRVHIKPALGALKLSELRPHQIQAFYNDLLKGKNGKELLAAKSIRNVNGVLHRALQQAVTLSYLKQNPCIGVKLPRIKEPEMHPLTEAQMKAFLKTISGHTYEMIFKVDMFTGMRQSEIMGLTWDRVDFEKGTIYVDRQLIREKKKGGVFKFAQPKNDRPRKLTPAPMVMQMLKEQKKRQAQARLKVGSLWNDLGFSGLVFTNEFGGPYVHNTVTHNTARIGKQIGVEGLRFHDLRHTYAVAALRAGDDVKTVQSNLGHATAAFTLDRYAHYTEDMRKDSAARMEAFMSGIVAI